MDYTARKLVQRHPLQWMESPSRTASAALHAGGLASFAYSYKYLIDHPNPINDSYGWHMQYLTIIGLSLATATFTVGLASDITLSTRLFRVKNFLAVTSAPMEVLVSILYWGLRAIDPKLVLPSWAPPLPVLYDVSFHGVPAIVLTLDILLLSPPWTISVAPACIISLILAFGYWFWVELCYSHNGFYPYPIFEQLNPPSRAALFALSAAVFAASTFALKGVQGLVNGGERPGKVKG
ncbi:hypothetical protein NA57DRAFT_81935 [Rhizodiscina lignyota]|uniref:FAR-17a/AIG1-like protein n=1 Tax=Rhizodiscina lignyota TaxID=1504668 RepID=A0A9P4M2Z6_9PEZI|nr:hypothetical protein NA57DRAFT_81935 [Rhizodiscina lignyota]